MEIFRQARAIDSRRHRAGVDYRYCRSQLLFRTAARSDAALPASGASFSVAHIPTTLRNRARASVLSFECKPSGRSGQSGNECIEIFVGVNRSFSIPSSLHSYSFFFIALETVHSLIAKNRPRKNVDHLECGGLREACSANRGELRDSRARALGPAGGSKNHWLGCK